MGLRTPYIALIGMVCLASNPSVAASLQAAPTVFEMPAGKAADTLRLRNDGTGVLNAQVRVFRWSQADGVDKIDPTTEIVTSPPMLTLQPGSEQVVRLVRVSKRPIVGEENYRVVVDEIPDKSKQKNGEIALTFKHSIPMFFTTALDGKSRVTWAMETKGDTRFIVAKNDGNRRVRIAGLTLKSPGTKDVVLGKGLNGYVLSGSSMRWVLPKTASVGSTGPVSVTARSDEGPIHASAQAQGSARR